MKSANLIHFVMHMQFYMFVVPLTVHSLDDKGLSYCSTHMRHKNLSWRSPASESTNPVMYSFGSVCALVIKYFMYLAEELTQGISLIGR